MFKSMTGFGKAEAQENGIKVIVEIKSLNGKYPDLNCRMPRYLQQYEMEMREIIKRTISRGTVTLNINVEYEGGRSTFNLNEDIAEKCYQSLESLRKRLKIRETVKIEHVLSFASEFKANEETSDETAEYKLAKKCLHDAVRNLDNMRKREGQQILKDLTNRLSNISEIVKKIEQQGFERIPAERERIRQKIAQMFENDEFDETRIQTEIVLLADKLDISEECVRLNSHLEYFSELMKSRDSEGRKINFLIQEINREINTIGSKANDADISQKVVLVKEELERIREQVQNIE